MCVYMSECFCILYLSSGVCICNLYWGQEYCLCVYVRVYMRMCVRMGCVVFMCLVIVRVVCVSVCMFIFTCVWGGGGVFCDYQRLLIF